MIVQENRSFDNLFQGYPGADTQSYGYTSTGKKVTLAADRLWTSVGHRSHVRKRFSRPATERELPGTDCKMDGFDKEM